MLSSISLPLLSIAQLFLTFDLYVIKKIHNKEKEIKMQKKIISKLINDRSSAISTSTNIMFLLK